MESLEIDDKLFESTKEYWIRGYIGRTYQSYLDATQMVEESCLDENEKQVEKEDILEARKEAFGDEFKYFPPWK